MIDELIVAQQADDECGTRTSTKGHSMNDDTPSSATNNEGDAHDTTQTTLTMTKIRANGSTTLTTNYPSFVRSGLYEEMVKQVVRKKLAKQRHLVLPKAIDAALLELLFQQMQKRNLFQPQTVVYNGGVANVPEWKISCYLEVMDGGIPTTNPNIALLQLYQPLLDAINVIFMDWYRQQHACNDPCRYSGKGGGSAATCTTSNNDDDDDDGNKKKNDIPNRGRDCRRLMTFITRYTPRPGEEALLKVHSMMLYMLIVHDDDAMSLAMLILIVTHAMTTTCAFE
jgi:hypothetical protein